MANFLILRQVLAQGVEEATFKLTASKKAIAACLAASLFGVLVCIPGASMAMRGIALGWGFLSVGAATIWIGGVGLLPGATYLRLTSEGFEGRHAYRSFRYKWNEVGPFRGITTKFSSLTFEVFGPTLESLRPASVQEAQSMLKMHVKTRRLPSTFGVRAESLADIMNNHRDAVIDPVPWRAHQTAVAQARTAQSNMAFPTRQDQRKSAKERGARLNKLLLRMGGFDEQLLERELAGDSNAAKQRDWVERALNFYRRGMNSNDPAEAEAWFRQAEEELGRIRSA